MDRREFLQKGSIATSAMMLLNANTAFGYQANSAVRLGLLGCGNRGTSVSTSFSRNTTAQVIALADLFADQLAAGHDHFNKLNAELGRSPIDDKLLFHGPHAFEQLAGSRDVDLIQISTPPFFHVQHLQAAVASGKHVYCEKPVGIDIRQAHHALEIAKQVKPGQSVDVGFQCRMAPPITAIAEKIKAGALGKIATATGNYDAPASTEKNHPGASKDEYRLRNWLWDRALSGDILVEQNIHIIDLCNWMIGSHPIKATATGGRNVLQHFGDCWDNYQVDFTYPDGIHFSFSSTQFGSDGKFDAGLKLFGAGGSATVPYSGPIAISGANAWQWRASDSGTVGGGQFAANGSFLDNLEFADRDKDRTFIDSITSGPAHNQIAAGVETALTCMLGRMAGLKQVEVTWEDLLEHGETYELGFSVDEFA
ncbi:MAG TPA: Gfo/Idh/MocA family oxidoreductase [Terracidiphilus sp.]|jgi:myo-inositol 2-dehydrogenase/D-chiro-inositol 1-dehydrogenase|nr:Gfo/Idh/MocA family oxidoreductase [Terracidiphilus sp.]